MPYSCFASTWRSQRNEKEGENPLNVLSFWDARTPEPPIYWEEWIIKFHWGMIAKYDIDPDKFYFARTLNAAAITALPGDVNGKNRIEAEKKLKSNLHLCIGDKAQRILKARKPAVNVKTERLPTGIRRNAKCLQTRAKCDT